MGFNTEPRGKVAPRNNMSGKQGSLIEEAGATGYKWLLILNCTQGFNPFPFSLCHEN